MTQTQNVKYTVTQDSVSLFWSGKMVTVKKGAANFENLRKAVLAEDWSEVPFHLRSDSSLERWAKGKFKVVEGKIFFNGDELPADLGGRITEMASLGDDPTPLMKFWENLQQNPSMRSVQQLWRFLQNSGHPITEDGHFLAYKAVRSDFYDIHSGTILNKPGMRIQMERNKISDDPDHACHAGLHVGALEYATNFGGYDKKMVICKVNPAHVVSVPNDHSSQKMRVSEYLVIGMHGEGLLPDTTIKDEELPQVSAKTLPGGSRRSKEYRRLDGLDEAGLMQEKYDTLRDYLSYGLEVVGASRIVGGKWALVQAITKARH